MIKDKKLCTFIAIIASISFIYAFDNELRLQATIAPSAEASMFNVGRLDESILFSTNNQFGAKITISDMGDNGETQLVSNGKIMLLPMSYAIFEKPLIIETPIQMDQKKEALLGIDISIN